MDPNLAAKALEEAEAERLGLQREKLQKREVGEEEGGPNEADLEAKELREKMLKGKDRNAELHAVALAALFVPHSPPTKSSCSSNLKSKQSLWTEDKPASETYHHPLDVLDQMQNAKNSGDRNTWQARQSSSQGDPFYRDSAGFEKGIQMTIEHGRAMYREKWGDRDCDIYHVGYRADDAWRVEHDRE